MLMIHCALEEHTPTLPLLSDGNHVKRDSSVTVFSFRFENRAWRAAGSIIFMGPVASAKGVPDFGLYAASFLGQIIDLNFRQQP